MDGPDRNLSEADPLEEPRRGGRMWVFVINLDRDRARLARMIAEAERVGISFERFAAVDGKNLGADLHDQFFSADGPHEPALTAGEIGCYASHLRIHKALAELGECALVLEDDVRLSDDIVDAIEAARDCSADWDIIRLSNETKSVVLPVGNILGSRELVRYWTVPNGTGAYLISRTGAIKFLESYERRTLPVDEDLRRPWNCDLNTYGILPPLVEPDVLDDSSIDSLGRDRRLPARDRFKDVRPFADAIAATGYRFKTFGPVHFVRGVLQSLAISVAKFVAGRRPARRFYRLSVRSLPRTMT
jgi:glycosyl transferase family 25